MAAIKIESHTIKLVYYTDPICSTCWLLEPYLNRLIHNYKSILTIDCRMGGLLPSWDEFIYPDFEMPKEMALSKLWNIQGKKYGISMDGDLWLKKPIKSSYPASIAFYAARNQNIKKSYEYLRLLREFVFLQNKDVSEESVLISAAIMCGLDVDLFLNDMKNGFAKAEFEKDLKEKEKWNINRFPTLVFLNESGETIIDDSFLKDNKGHNIYKHWESIIEKLLGQKILKQSKQYNALYLLEKYKSMSLPELLIISAKPKSVIEQQLDIALKKGLIIKENHKYGVYYRYNKTLYHLKKSNFKIKHAAIIGGGISGYAMALNLIKNGVVTSVFERHSIQSNKGFGFLILKNGIDAMDSFGLKNELLKKGNMINFFKALTPDGNVIYTKILDNCIAISRDTFLNILISEVGNHSVFYNHEFSEILFDENGKIDSLKFIDGKIIKSDIFIASDGIKSNIRSQIFKDKKLNPVGEREIVSLVYLPNLVIKQDEFIKILDVENGKSMGLIPLGDDIYIWFLQFNQATHPINGNTADILKQYAIATVASYPHEFKKAIENTDFNKAFLWISERMDLLPAFHQNNLVFVGDSAHPLLALTSQGANSALEDAASLSCLLSKQKDTETLENIFSKYYKKRKRKIAYYIHEGDVLVNYFLTLNQNKSFKLPLSLH